MSLLGCPRVTSPTKTHGGGKDEGPEREGNSLERDEEVEDRAGKRAKKVSEKSKNKYARS